VFCPVCGDEYRPGFSRCSDCDVELTENPPPEIQEAPPFELVTVLETGDQSLVAVAKSVLGGPSRRPPLLTKQEASMGRRAESLADRIEEGVAGLAAFADGLSEAEWRTPLFE
jgi:hypothetical protein